MAVRKTQEEIAKYAASRKYELLSEYVNCSSPITLKCPNGCIWTTTWMSFGQGHECLICFGNHVITQEEAEAQIAKKGHKLISKYKGVHALMTVICKCGREWTTSYRSILKSTNCPQCSSHRPKTLEEIQNTARARSYEVLGGYSNNRGSLVLKCPKGHRWETTWKNFDGKNSDCPYCQNHKQEYEIRVFLESLGEKPLINKRKIIKPYELSFRS